MIIKYREHKDTAVIETGVDEVVHLPRDTEWYVETGDHFHIDDYDLPKAEDYIISVEGKGRVRAQWVMWCDTHGNETLLITSFPVYICALDGSTIEALHSLS